MRERPNRRQYFDPRALGRRHCLWPKNQSDVGLQPFWPLTRSVTAGSWSGTKKHAHSNAHFPCALTRPRLTGVAVRRLHWIRQRLLWVKLKGKRSVMSVSVARCGQFH